MKPKVASRIVILFVLLALIFSAIRVTPAQALGPFSHNEVARLAYDLLSESDLKSLLGEYKGLVLAGSVYPDWGMAYSIWPFGGSSDPDKFNNLAEYAHWPTFIAAYIKYFRILYQPPYDTPEEKQSIAFLFGLIVHNVSDPLFHQDFLPYAYDVDNTNSHSDVELGVDSFNVWNRGAIYYDEVDWSFLPVTLIMSAYQDMYDHGLTSYTVDSGDLDAGWNTYEQLSGDQILYEWISYSHFHDLLPNTYNSYYSYQPGGIADAAQHVKEAWIATWDLLDYTGANYAKPDGSDTADCRSWENACTLQRALIHSIPGMEIWVAAGTYKPTTGSDRTVTFQLNFGVAVYGGFPNEGNPAFADRDPVAYPTILSGDLLGNDNSNIQYDEPTRADNSYHVVTGGESATLDGFIITGGNANGAPINSSGAGTDNGGGMYNRVSTTIRNVTFIGNSAYHGGGMYNYQYNLPLITNVTFINNSAQDGGGMYNFQNGVPRLMNVTFYNNSATNGGGMYNYSDIDTVTRPALVNVTFSGNLADVGGGMYNGANSAPTLKNVIIANSSSGGDCVNSGGSPDGSSSNNLIEDASNACGLINGSNGNIIGNDPLFGTLGNYGGLTQIFPLRHSSPAIDAGNDTVCAGLAGGNYDQRGVARPQGSHCDIGAYEHNELLYVTETGSDTGDCLSWYTACTLQTALTMASLDGDEIQAEIWVAEGLYPPTTNAADRAATFQLGNGLAVYGGFAGDETRLDQRHGGASILSGDIDNNDSQTPIITDLTTVTGNTTNSYHVVTGASGATLDRFTITAGYANGAYPNDQGGGVYNNNSSPTITNVTLSGNTATRGGGMFNDDNSSPTVTNVTFSGNSATDSGGGMYNISSSPTVTNVTFSNNSATNLGGGMFNNDNSSPVLTNVTFSGNSAYNGGGMGNIAGNPQIRNTIFWGNTATFSGAQIYNGAGTPIVSDSVVQGGYAGGTNIITADPLLGALGNYGGSTQTIPILPGSPAFSATSANCPATDQRGMTRSTSICDIGAYELDGYSGIHYAKPAASGLKSCRSWEDACTLQTALLNAASGSEIWVMQGIHQPTTRTTYRAATFQLISGVAVYGGFPATGNPVFADRNPAAYPTILSGDIDGNDSQTPIITNLSTVTGNTTNSYHVVAGASNATLDGFTITAGYANGTNPGDWGGGMYNNLGSPTITNVTFSGNWAGSGGGMYNNLGSPTLTNVTLSGNSAFYHGGGMYSYQGSPVFTDVTFSNNSAPNGHGGGLRNNQSSPTLTNVTFSGNSARWGGGVDNNQGSPSFTNVTFNDNDATDSGGGMYNEQSSPAITNATFSLNTAVNFGGGMANHSSNPTLAEVTFSTNTVADSGGGMYNFASSPILTNVTFDYNSAPLSHGGGVYNYQASSMYTSVTFSNNWAKWGGGVHNYQSSPLFTNVTFSGNSASENGGGMGNHQSSPLITNATFNGNDAPDGGGMHNYSGSNPQIRNTILWGNTGSTNTQISNVTNSTPVVSYSVVQGIYSGTGNLSTDPKLGALGSYGGSTQTIPLQAGSSAINNGDDSLCSASVGSPNYGAGGLDQRGVTRPQGTRCDIGAYEYEGYFGIYYVKPTASGTGDCHSWANACTLQTALANAVSGDQIWVAAGTYKPTTGTDRTATFQLKHGVAVYGGFDGETDDELTDRSQDASLTILSGDIGASGNNSDNSYHVVTGANNATLDGFTVTAGNANGATPNGQGGGMYNNNSSPIVMNVTFSGNSAAISGGGMENLYGSSPMVMNVTFSGNTAQWGGGMDNYSSSNPVLTNVTLSNNTATDNGGGMNNNGSSPILTNVTFSGNTGVNGAGGIFNYSGSNPQIRNTILWGNTPTQIVDNGSTPNVTYSVVQGIYSGTGNLSTDPKLGALGSYGGSTQTIPLQAGSSAINNGDDSLCSASVGSPNYGAGGLDQRGVTRPQGTHCDIGAYEYIGYFGTYHARLTASGTGDCHSWENACTLQTALANAVSGDQIWVAAGTYKPTAGTDRTATFQLKHGVAVYGGFPAMGSPIFADRNPAAYPTILSGDIDGNDSQTPIITNLSTVTGNTTNSYHVVTGASNATLDGFTITAGYANGTNPGDWGGGMYNNLGSPTITNVTFSGNWAGSGGGMYSYQGSPVFTDVTFSNNSAPNGYGGGLFNNQSSPTLTDVTFSSNSAPNGYGGGLFNNQSSPTLTNVTFSGNTARGGGGVYNNQGGPSFTNVTFSGNSATENGGGMGNAQSSPWITNATFNGNSAPDGGGMYNNDSSSPQIRNTILWGNTGTISPQIANYTNSTPVVSYSVVQDGYNGTGNLSTDPKLGTLDNYGGSTQTIPLQAGSPAINIGFPTYCTIGTDQRGVSYVGTCDIGAYEYNGSTITYYAKPTASDSENCQSWATACTLQKALSIATNGDQIWVAEGVYKPTTADTDPRQATFQLKSGVVVYGGFPDTGNPGFGDRNPGTYITILSGDIGTSGDNSDNSYHVVIGATGATLDGFTITAGNANGTSPDDHGGGMYNNNSSPIVTNVILSGNTAAISGGGMVNLYSSNPTVTNVTFRDNSATWGGGMNNYSNSNPVLRNVTLSNNTATDSGGGMNNDGSSPILTNVTFSGNTGVNGAGGIFNYSGSNPQIRNTILWGNTPTQIVDSGSTPNVTYSIVQGGYNGTGNLSADPKLGLLDNYGGSTQTIPLLPDSSAINAGHADYCTTGKDQRGASYAGTCDIGSFEYTYAGAYRAKMTASGAGTCDSWENACTLQTALRLSVNSQQIWVAAGTYRPATTDTDPRKATFQLTEGVAIYGGFPDTGNPILADRDPAAYPTILSGDLSGNDNDNVQSNEPTRSDNSYHVVTGAYGATLDGFTVTGGNANGSFIDDYDLGGGMYNRYASPTVTNVSFTRNSASWYGGGMYNYYSSLTVANVTFSANYALYGAGMYNNNSNATFANITFSGNSTSWMGRGGGMANFHSSPQLTNVTISGNWASMGSGMYNNQSNPTVRNTILWGNTGDAAQISNNNSAPVVSDSVIQGGYAGGTNILTADPLLGALGNYGGFTPLIQLLPGSSAIDSGNDTICAATVGAPNYGAGGLDQRGVVRPQGAHCDIGAVEMDPATFHTISGNVGLAGATIHYAQTFTMAGSDGSYSFSVYDGWSGTVTPSNPGYVFSPASRDYSNVTADISGEDYTPISGYDISGNAGVAGVAITYPGGSTTSEEDGSYLFTVPPTGWSGTVTPSKAGYTFNPASRNYPPVTGNISDQDYAATPIEYTLTITSDHGTVTKDPDQSTYHYGDVVTLTVTSEAGWTFAGWTPPLADNQVTIAGDTTITATYTQDEYTLTVTSAHGTVTKDPDQATYRYGDVVTLSVTSEAGWTFAGWTPSLTDNQVTITGDTTITATHTQDEYALTVVSGHGTVTKSPDQPTYRYGDVVTLTVTPEAGWTFTGWTPSLTDNQVTIAGDTTITATYTQDEHTLTVVSDHGTVAKDPDQSTYHYGDVVTLSVTPEAGWTFAGWTPPLADNQVTIAGDTTITATYTQDEYTLTVVSDHGTVTKDPDQPTYRHGDVVTLSVTSEAGWTFTGWTPSLTDNQVTIAGDTTITATYTQDEHTLTVNSDHGTVTKSPDQPTYCYGDVVTLSVTPEAGWTFTGWTPSLTDNQVTIAGDTTITANYIQKVYLPLILYSGGR